VLFFAVGADALSAASRGDSSAAPCTPTSVLYEIDDKDRQRLSKILDEAGQVANGEAVLWRVAKVGVAPSYLFGTVHVVDPSLQALSPVVRAALDQSHVVAVESVETSRRAMARVMAEASPLMVSGDKELQRILSVDEIAVVEKALADAGYPSQLAFGIRPWVATMFLADSRCQRSLQDQGLKPLDVLVVERAERNGVPLVGLETPLEQYRSLAAISSGLQAAWLKASIELHPRVDDMSETIAELYRFRKLDAVWPITQELAQQTGLDDATMAALRDELVVKRNARMLEHALPLIEDGAAFIAVGAMHHIGPGGLVAALREKGYQVTPVE